MREITLRVGDLLIRNLEPEDAEPMTALADNPRISDTLRDLFPHPYRLQNALEFIAGTAKGRMGENFAIVRDGEFLGVVGFRPGEDVYRGTAEIGYWVGEPFWGQGIMTKVVAKMSAHMLTALGFRRVFAVVFSSNPASARVLAKAGFVQEGVHRNHVLKNGEVLDEWMYARISEDL